MEVERSRTQMEDLSGLPESCVSHTLSFTSPRDACRAATVSTTFRSASESDAVWDKFLPPDYLDILSRSVSPVEFSSKRDLYFRLCNSVLLDGGKLSFSLDKSSGKKCNMLPARELLIVWADVPKYWRWIAFRASRFQEAAELLGVCWLEIHGKINTAILSPRTKYAACLVFKFVEGASGLNQLPVELSIAIRGNVHKRKGYLFVDYKERQQRQHDLLQQLLEKSASLRQEIKRVRKPLEDVQVPRIRDDGWSEIELGEFFTIGEDDGEVEVSLVEVKGRNLKKGMIIEVIEIRPKQNLLC